MLGWNRVVRTLRAVEAGHELREEVGDELDRSNGSRVRHTRRPEDPYNAERLAGHSIWGKDEGDAVHLNGRVLAANEEADLTPLGDVLHQFAEIAAPLERREDVTHPRTLGKLGGLHHIEESIAVHLLHRRIVDLGE